MAKQAGDFFIEGTIDDLTFYKMCEEYYVRMKSSLTGKRFWRDKKFEGSRKSCSRFGKGNKLASIVFKLIKEEKRTSRLFPFLRTKAIALLKEGRSAEEVLTLLVDYLHDFGFISFSINRRSPAERFSINYGPGHLHYRQPQNCFLYNCSLNNFVPRYNTPIPLLP